MSEKLFLNRLLIPELVNEIFDTIVEFELSFIYSERKRSLKCQLSLHKKGSFPLKVTSATKIFFAI